MCSEAGSAALSSQLKNEANKHPGYFIPCNIPPPLDTQQQNQHYHMPTNKNC
jgi:hypothetical protein